MRLLPTENVFLPQYLITKYENLNNLLFYLPCRYLFCAKNKQNAFDFGYTHQLPIGKLAERFGDNSTISFSFMQEKESNVFYGIQGGYLFGNNVKDTTIFDNITTSTGAIIGSDVKYANVNLME